MKNWEPDDPCAERRLRFEAYFIAALMAVMVLKTAIPTPLG